jgi:hypothetical protein
VRYRQSDGNMTIMPASMHHTRVLRRIFGSGLLKNRKGIHVETQHQDRTGLSAFYQRHHACRGNARLNYQPERSQLMGNDLGCAIFLETQLWKAMEVSPQTPGVVIVSLRVDDYLTN